MARQLWKPWHEVVKLREDLRSGDLPMHLFAADLYEVMMQNGKRPVYEKPEEFFALTFPTHNLRSLVRDVVLRLAGKNDKAVRQLELTYGGGKTHTLITMRHLVADPSNLPELPAVREFEESIGMAPPQARVAALCFDKLDVETGMDVRAPDGSVRRLKQPWSVLAYQLAGDGGLKLLHAQGKAEERQSPPAENTLSALLALPAADRLSTLILIDEVLLYAKVRVRAEPGWLDNLTSFFQYLTQAASKVDRCCIVASLLSSEPRDQADDLGKQIVAQIYDIFQRQREAAVQPVEKDDVAEVLRRRLFDPNGIMDRQIWPQHVIAALKGIQALDEQTAGRGAAEEARYLKAFPFHPELTEVFYTKWSAGIERFQKTRGVLRTFALALREAEKWDESPLVGPAVFLNAPQQGGLSESARELVSIADTIVTDGQAARWTGILEAEFSCARHVQDQSVGLKLREIEQAVMGTFLHSQPVGMSAKTRDLELLIGPCRPDKIELEKALARWARSSYWLDDAGAADKDGALPEQWRLGNRPNLNQMQAAAAAQFSDEVIRARLIDEIARTKSLTSGASALGVRVHTLPERPRDIEDDGLFHYAVLGPDGASDSGKPGAKARQFINETTTPEKPRVFRNAVLLLAPSRDGLEVAHARVRDYLAWEKVKSDLTAGGDESSTPRAVVDMARMQTLAINIDKARSRLPEAIKQAYCIVVTVSEKNEDQAFKINVSDDPHFLIIKSEARARIQDTAITAEALLPDGPYNLWKGAETSRRVKDLAGAFAQLPHLPKMLKSQAIIETLVRGCMDGTFVLKLARPDRTFRTWWRSAPDEAALSDPAMELILPEAAELSEISPDLLVPGVLPGLWESAANDAAEHFWSGSIKFPLDAKEEITVQSVLGYFSGKNHVSVDKGAYQEKIAIPGAPPQVLYRAVADAVAAGKLWMLSGPASLLGEIVPPGIIAPEARLRMPPPPASAAAILPANLVTAWQSGETNALAIATALSHQAGYTLPWKTVRDVISGALNARFVELANGTVAWPCELPVAQGVKLKVCSGQIAASNASGVTNSARPAAQAPMAAADFEPSRMQDLAELIPSLLAVSAKAGIVLKFHVRLEIGESGKPPSDEVVKALNAVFERLGEGFRLR